MAKRSFKFSSHATSFDTLKVMKDNNHLLVNETGEIVVDTCSEWGHNQTLEVCHANAARIMACVNACVNLSDSQLQTVVETGGFKN